MVLQAIPAKRTLVNQPAACMHFTRELVEFFISVNLGVWMLIYFLNQRELETRSQTVHLDSHSIPPAQPSASPTVSLQMPWLPASPQALLSSTLYLLLCWCVILSQWWASAGPLSSVGTTFAAPIPAILWLWLAENQTTVDIMGCCFVPLSTFYKLLFKYITSQTSWGSVKLLTEMWMLGWTHPLQLWISPFSGKESFQRGSEGAWSKEALLSTPWEECATPVSVAASVPMATTSLPCYFWRARAGGSIILGKKKMMLSPPSLEISQVSSSSSMRFPIT